MIISDFVGLRLIERQRSAEAVIRTWNPEGDPSRVKTSTAVGRELTAAHFALRLTAAQLRTQARHSACGYGVGRCDDGGKAWEYDDPDTGPGCAELQDLAAPDQDHPDFNPAWKIEDPS